LESSSFALGRQCTYGHFRHLAVFSIYCNFLFYNITTDSQATLIMAAQTQPRQNYHQESEAGVNKQINMELYASYVYQSMGFYFDRDDVALKGFAKYFKDQSKEEREHAEKLMKYQNDRGGRIVLQDVMKPEKDEWQTGEAAMGAALQLEKHVNQALLDLHGVAGKHNDPHMADFLESHFLDEQVQSIKELSDFVTKLRRLGPGVGEHLFDKELQ